MIENIAPSFMKISNQFESHQQRRWYKKALVLSQNN